MSEELDPRVVVAAMHGAHNRWPTTPEEKAEFRKALYDHHGWGPRAEPTPGRIGDRIADIEANLADDPLRAAQELALLRASLDAWACNPSDHSDHE